MSPLHTVCATLSKIHGVAREINVRSSVSRAGIVLLSEITFLLSVICGSYTLLGLISANRDLCQFTVSDSDCAT